MCPQVNDPVPIGNSAHLLYQCPSNTWIRPIIISINQAWVGGNVTFVQLGSTPTFMNFLCYLYGVIAAYPWVWECGHLDMWLQPNWSIQAMIVGCTAIGFIEFNMIYEEITKGTAEHPDKLVKIEQPIDTTPFPLGPLRRLVE